MLPLSGAYRRDVLVAGAVRLICEDAIGASAVVEESRPQGASERARNPDRSQRFGARAEADRGEGGCLHERISYEEGRVADPQTDQCGDPDTGVLTRLPEQV